MKECIDAITAALGRDPTEAEVEAIAEAVQERLRRKISGGASPREAAGAVGEEMQAAMKLKAAIAKRDAYNNLLRHADLMNRIVPGEEVATEKAALSGRVSGSGRGYADSVDANHHGLVKRLLGPAIAQLEQMGLLKAMLKGDASLDRDVARELFRVNDKENISGTGNKHAEQIAQVLSGVMDTGRAMMNKAGAFIGQVENYMGRQYHDMWKIRGDGSDGAFKVWRDFIFPRLDIEKMFPDSTAKSIEESLHSTWKALSSGVFDGSDKAALAGFKGGSNLGRKVSEGRSILFKDADSWTEYNRKFGKGSVMDAIFAGADRAARDTAIMQKFGTNPEAMFNRWHSEMLQAAVERGDFKAADKLRGNPNKGLFDMVAGRMEVGNQTIASIAATVRNAQQLIHLGSVIFPALSHLAIVPDVLRHNGVPFFERFGSTVRSLVSHPTATTEIAHSLGAGIDGMMGHIIHRFRVEDGVPGHMAEAVNMLHKINGFGYYLDAMRKGMGLALSHNLAYHAEKEFAQLEPKMQATLRRYGIEAAEWDHGRATAQTAADGRNYILPAHMADEAIGQKFQTYITDQIREGLNDHTPTARLQASFGLKAGTVSGEIVRSMLQFKAFTLTLMERQMGRAFMRSGVDVPGALYLMVGMTLMGYAGITLRDMASNKTPRSPKDLSGWGALVRDSMIRGGAFGLYGDILANTAETTGAGVMKSIAGPAPSFVFDTVAAIHAITAGSETKNRGQIAEAKLQHLGASLMPNLFYAKGVYDYLFPYAFQEMANPGAKMRAEKQMRQQGQTWMLRLEH